MNLNQWAIQWGVPFEAVEDLRQQLGTAGTDPAPLGGESEAAADAGPRRDGGVAGIRAPGRSLCTVGALGGL